MTASVTVYQPRYYPRLHYLARVQAADIFIIYDDVEFSRQSRQHRAEIDFGGARWITIPVKHTGNETLIKDARIDMERHWIDKHLNTIQAKYGGDSSDLFRAKYDSLGEDARLVDITIPTMSKLFDIFDVDTQVVRSSSIDIEPKDDPSEYLAELVNHYEGDTYISGGAGYENYLREEPFDEYDIDVTVQNWTPTWDDGNVCALDVVMNSETPHEYIV